MKTVFRYSKIWWLMSRNAFLAVLSQRVGFGIFLLGKTLRFVFFFGFIFFLLKGTNRLAGYNLNQTLLFFLTFSLIDTVSQFLFREVYRFRPLVVSGSFDLVLVKPVNALFRSLMGGADIIDLVTIPPLIIAVIYAGSLLQPSSLSTLYYVLLVLNGLLLAASFHIIVLSFGIITLEIDHTIVIYRDLANLARFPIDIYHGPVKGFLTFFVPIGVMMAFPAKALLGLISPAGVVWSLALGVLWLFIALRFWRFALKKYTSASS